MGPDLARRTADELEDVARFLVDLARAGRHTLYTGAVPAADLVEVTHAVPALEGWARAVKLAAAHLKAGAAG